MNYSEITPKEVKGKVCQVICIVRKVLREEDILCRYVNNLKPTGIYTMLLEDCTGRVATITSKGLDVYCLNINFDLVKSDSLTLEECLDEAKVRKVVNL